MDAPPRARLGCTGHQRPSRVHRLAEPAAGASDARRSTGTPDYSAHRGCAGWQNPPSILYWCRRPSGACAPQRVWRRHRTGGEEARNADLLDIFP